MALVRHDGLIEVYLLIATFITCEVLEELIVLWIPRWTSHILTVGISGLVACVVLLRLLRRHRRQLNVHADLLAALRANEEQVRLLLNSTAEAIYGIDMHGNCTFANAACVRLTGYGGPHDLLGKNMHDLIHHSRLDGSHYPVEECHIFQAFCCGQDMHVDDEVFWRADGTSFPAEYWSYPLRREGKVVGAVVTFIDITKRSQALQQLRESELRLRQSESRYRELVETSPDLVWSTDAEGRFTFVNAQALDAMFGYQPQEWLGRRFTEFTTPEEVARLMPIFQHVLSGEVQSEIEAEFLHKNGATVSVRCMFGAAPRDECGIINGISGHSRNITTRKKSERELAYSARCSTARAT